MKKVLFICNFGQNRSRTAAELYADKFDTRFAGIYNNPVTREHVLWADRIIVMEEEHKAYIMQKWPEFRKRVFYCLNIPDVYRYMQDELVEKLK
jgi:predicted protein tyrosine phosphatase